MASFQDRARAALRAWRTPDAAFPPLVAGAAPAKRAVDTNYAFPAAKGGRQTQPSNYNPFGLQGWYFIPKRQWQDIDVEELDVTAFSAEQLLALLPDLNADMSMALWSYLRHAGTDIEFEVLTPNGDEYPAGQLVLDDLIEGINAQFGGMDALVRQLLTSAYLQGAVALEAAPTKNLKDLEDLYPVNPDSIWFQRDSRQILVPFQRQIIWGNLAAAYPYRMMNEETFFYIPVDPYIDDPYGRPPVAPALQEVFGLNAVLRDLQRVMHQHGFPRVDVELIYEALEQTMPEAVLESTELKYNWMTARMGEVIAAYNGLAPEDAFVHWDFVQADHHKEASGARGRNLEIGVVVQVFRDQLITALKSLPIFHGGGSQKGSTETYGTVEYEIYVASVETLRDIAAVALVRGLTVAMQFRGVAALVKHHWKPIRTTQRLQDALAEATEIENEVNKRDQGWVTQDDASNAITDSDAVGPAPAPAVAPLAPLKPFAQTAPPGSTTFPPGSAAPPAAKPAPAAGAKAGAGEPERLFPIYPSGAMTAYTMAAISHEVERALGVRR